jgi:hypothetical protein
MAEPIRDTEHFADFVTLEQWAASVAFDSNASELIISEIARYRPQAYETFTAPPVYWEVAANRSGIHPSSRWYRHNNRSHRA